MNFAIENAHPRRWLGYISPRRPYREHDFSSLETLAKRKGTMNFSKPRPLLLRNEVLAVIPVGRQFTIAEIVGKLPGVTYNSVASMICVLITEGYPISRVDKKKPVKYWRT